MIQIKQLMKDLLHKVQDVPDVPFNSVRMSEIASRSMDIISPATDQHVDVETDVSGPTPPPTPPQADEQDISREAKNQPKQTHLFPIVTVSHDRGSQDSVVSAPIIEKPKILMGRRALLRSRSSDSRSIEHQAEVVRELVEEKYHDKISNCIGKIYQRRLSREASEDGTASNQSMSYDGTTYFAWLYPSGSDCTDSIDKSNNDLYNSSDSCYVQCDEESLLSSTLKGEALSMELFQEASLRKSAHFRSVDHVIQPSSLLTRAGSFYNSVRRSIRRTCSFTEKNKKDKSPNVNRCQSYTPNDFGPTEDLMRQLYVQSDTILQASKALAYCKDSKDMTSPEYIEAERILLVASAHKEAIKRTLNVEEFDDKHERQNCNGSLEITDVICYLKGDLCIEQETPKSFDEHFVIVVTSSDTVVGSKVLAPDKNGQIKSNQRFRLMGLPIDFEVSLAVYSMQVKHAHKGHGNGGKKDRKTPCPSAKGLLKGIHKATSRKNLSMTNVCGIKTSAFTLCGTCNIHISDMEKSRFRMERVPVASSLEGYFTANLTGEVKLTNRKTGFLTIGFDMVWNRRWCVLEGSLLKYWNYPSEEATCHPVGSIDLGRALEKASPADRSICPRPKSLCLLVKNRDSSVMKYFLSADSMEDKLGWLEEINCVIGTLGAWNCLRPKELVTDV